MIFKKFSPPTAKKIAAGGEFVFMESISFDLYIIYRECFILCYYSLSFIIFGLCGKSLLF